MLRSVYMGASVIAHRQSIRCCSEDRVAGFFLLMRVPLSQYDRRMKRVRWTPMVQFATEINQLGLSSYSTGIASLPNDIEEGDHGSSHGIVLLQ